MNAFDHAVRQLARRPLFTLLVVAVLSLGFGAVLTVGEIADSGAAPAAALPES
jgi:hypothetical protein